MHAEQERCVTILSAGHSDRRGKKHVSLTALPPQDSEIPSAKLAYLHELALGLFVAHVLRIGARFRRVERESVYVEVEEFE